jgi:hypothetical protein
MVKRKGSHYTLLCTFEEIFIRAHWRCFEKKAQMGIGTKQTFKTIVTKHATHEYACIVFSLGYGTLLFGNNLTDC